jgi:hypothetical protein
MHCKIIWSEKKKEQAIEKLTKYFEKYGVGEMIMQNDDALIEAPEVLSDIADDILIENEGIIFEE